MEKVVEKPLQIHCYGVRKLSIKMCVLINMHVYLSMVVQKLSCTQFNFVNSFVNSYIKYVVCILSVRI